MTWSLNLSKITQSNIKFNPWQQSASKFNGLSVRGPWTIASIPNRDVIVLRHILHSVSIFLRKHIRCLNYHHIPRTGREGARRGWARQEPKVVHWLRHPGPAPTEVYAKGQGLVKVQDMESCCLHRFRVLYNGFDCSQHYSADDESESTFSYLIYLSKDNFASILREALKYKLKCACQIFKSNAGLSRRLSMNNMLHIVYTYVHINSHIFYIYMYYIIYILKAI